MSYAALERIVTDLVRGLERNALGSPGPLGLFLAEEILVAVSVTVAVFAFGKPSAHAIGVTVLRNALPRIFARATVVQLDLLAGDGLTIRLSLLLV